MRAFRDSQAGRGQQVVLDRLLVCTPRERFDRAAGPSRTARAPRFARPVGAPPPTYLTDWRMTLAGALLTESVARSPP